MLPESYLALSYLYEYNNRFCILTKLVRSKMPYSY